MKKFLLPLVATTLLLTGCSGSGKLDLPSGGTEVDLTKTALVAEKCANTVKQTLNSASSGISLSLNLHGDLKLTYTVESAEAKKTYKVNVTGFNADINLTTSRFFGKTLDDVDAALTIKNLKGKLDIETETFSMNYELQPVELSAYLQDGFVFVDASNANLKVALPVFLKKIDAFKDLTDEQINAIVEQYLGAKRKAYIDLSDRLSEISIEDFPTLIDLAEIKESVKTTLENLAKEFTLKNYLTVKTYESSKWGVKLAMDKAGLKTIVEKVHEPAEAEAIMKGITTADSTTVVLTDEASRLSSIESEIAMVAAYEGSNVDSKIGAKLTFDYDKTVEFPSDLDQYTPFIVG